MSFWSLRRGPPIGTPENPEIIEPGQNPYSAPRSSFGRWRAMGQLLRWMLVLSLPVFLFDSICFWLFQLGTQPGGWLAWPLLIVFALPAFMITVFVLLVDCALLLALIMSGFGRNLNFPLQNIQMRVFRGPPRF